MLVSQFGASCWAHVCLGMPGRTARQCRDRWNHYLSSANPDEPWSADEDDLLVQKIEEIGRKWMQLAKFFPSRTDLEVMRRWGELFRERRQLLRQETHGPVRLNRGGRVGRQGCETHREVEEPPFCPDWSFIEKGENPDPYGLWIDESTVL
jgi:hypothetical protein